MSPRVRKWGSLTILSGLGATLFSALIIWLFATTLKNYVKFEPLNNSIERLGDIIQEVDRKALLEHKAIMFNLNKMNARMNSNEVKLFRVMDDCNENHLDLKKCRATHIKGI